MISIRTLLLALGLTLLKHNHDLSLFPKLDSLTCARLSCVEAQESGHQLDSHPTQGLQHDPIAEHEVASSKQHKKSTKKHKKKQQKKRRMTPQQIHAKQQKKHAKRQRKAAAQQQGQEHSPSQHESEQAHVASALSADDWVDEYDAPYELPYHQPEADREESMQVRHRPSEGRPHYAILLRSIHSRNRPTTNEAEEQDLKDDSEFDSVPRDEFEPPMPSPMPRRADQHFDDEEEVDFDSAVIDDDDDDDTPTPSSFNPPAPTSLKSEPAGHAPPPPPPPHVEFKPQPPSDAEPHDEETSIPPVEPKKQHRSVMDRIKRLMHWKKHNKHSPNDDANHSKPTGWNNLLTRLDLDHPSTSSEEDNVHQTPIEAAAMFLRSTKPSEQKDEEIPYELMHEPHEPIDAGEFVSPVKASVATSLSADNEAQIGAQHKSQDGEAETADESQENDAASSDASVEEAATDAAPEEEGEGEEAAPQKHKHEHAGHKHSKAKKHHSKHRSHSHSHAVEGGEGEENAHEGHSHHQGGNEGHAHQHAESQHSSHQGQE